MAKPQGKCIFCEGFGLTKEHLFSDWLREIFPRTATDVHTFGRRDYAVQANFERKVRQGHPGTRVVRKVCQVCNNGWISRIDDAAKHAAFPLIQGILSMVDQTTQRDVATWLSKMAMVGDALNPEKAVVRPVDRNWMMEKHLAPMTWEVWIGTYGGAFWRELSIFQKNGPLTLPVSRGGQPLSGYMISTVFGMGNLFGLVIGTSIEDIGYGLGSVETYMKRIWPTSQAFSWPLPHIMSDDEAPAVANILDSMIANPVGIDPSFRVSSSPR